MDPNNTSASDGDVLRPVALTTGTSCIFQFSMWIADESKPKPDLEFQMPGADQG